ncbi:hypothetical protein [Crenalkalicoccus roseus]|uniref:hypothetical protein n=1 Tax=Crenalkalicoccus roseus TaxID=1485588 RepID=UPI0010801191|nr:hypothetical protein [Crenalkalicoccus roseus]
MSLPERPAWLGSGAETASSRRRRVGWAIDLLRRLDAAALSREDRVEALVAALAYELAQAPGEPQALDALGWTCRRLGERLALQRQARDEALRLMPPEGRA